LTLQPAVGSLGAPAQPASAHASASPKAAMPWRLRRAVDNLSNTMRMTFRLTLR
jgi:hypothetical protein